MDKRIIEAYARLKAGLGGAEQLLEEILNISHEKSLEMYYGITDNINEKHDFVSDITFRELLYEGYIKELSQKD